MRKLILLTLIMCLPGCSQAPSDTPKDYTALAATLYAVAIIQPDDGVTPPDDGDNEDDCLCDGKGFIVHGDNHRTPCPCEGGCDCGESGGTTPTEVREVEEAEEQRSKQVIYFTASWCSWCQKVKPELRGLKSQKWDVGTDEDSAIRVVDFDDNQDVARQYGITSLPTFVKLEDGTETSRVSGFLNAFQIADLYNGEGNGERRR